MILTIDTEHPESVFCKDWFLFGTAEIQHFETFFMHGQHRVIFKHLSQNAKEDILKNGVRVYLFCDGYVDTFISAYNFALQFLGGLGTNPYIPVFGSHVPEYMIQANIAFLNHTMGVNLQERPSHKYFYDEKFI